MKLGSSGEPLYPAVRPEGLQAKVRSLGVHFGVALSGSQTKDHPRAEDKAALWPFTTLLLKVSAPGLHIKVHLPIAVL